MSRREILARLDVPVRAGATYGVLKVVRLLREEQRKGDGEIGVVVRYWLCLCTCGRQEEILGRRLRFDGWTSCSLCRHREARKERRTSARSPGHRLSEEQRQELDRLLIEGRQTSEIVEALGTTEQTVTRARRRLGIKPALRTQGMHLDAVQADLVTKTIWELQDRPHWAILAELARQGLPQVSKSTISRYRRQLGLPDRRGS